MTGLNPGFSQFVLGASPMDTFGQFGLSVPSASVLANPWWMPQLSSGLGGMAGMGQIGGAAGALNDMFTYRPEGQSEFGGFASGAMKGALAGSMWSPWGAAVGGLLGGFAGKR
jgi:hypothetical protein